mgnify:CR=1 FL=1
MSAGSEEMIWLGPQDAAAEVTPVSQIGEYSFKPGNLSLSLMDDYAKMVRRQLVSA